MSSNYTIDSGLNSPLPSVDETEMDSPDDSIIRGGGRRTIYEQALNDGSAGAKCYKSFTITGAVEIRRLYGVFTDVTDVTTVSGCQWGIFRSAATAGPDITAASVDCSGVTVDSVVLKASDDASAAVLLDSAAPAISEVSADRQFQSIVVNAMQGTDTWLCFICTEDDDTDAVLTEYCEWVPLTPDSEIVAGPGTAIPPV